MPIDLRRNWGIDAHIVKRGVWAGQMQVFFLERALKERVKCRGEVRVEATMPARCSRAMSLKRRRRGEPCAIHAELVGQLPGELRIQRLVAFAQAHGVFADYRDDFSLLNKFKQVFPEIAPNRAHPQFVASCQFAEPASAGKLAIESVFTALRFTFGISAALRALATRRWSRTVPDRPGTGIELSESAVKPPGTEMFDRRLPLALCRCRPVTLIQGAVT